MCTNGCFLNKFKKSWLYFKRLFFSFLVSRKKHYFVHCSFFYLQNLKYTLRVTHAKFSLRFDSKVCHACFTLSCPLCSESKLIPSTVLFIEKSHTWETLSNVKDMEPSKSQHHHLWWTGLIKDPINQTPSCSGKGSVCFADSQKMSSMSEIDMIKKHIEKSWTWGDICSTFSPIPDPLGRLLCPPQSAHVARVHEASLWQCPNVSAQVKLPPVHKRLVLSPRGQEAGATGCVSSSATYLRCRRVWRLPVWRSSNYKDCGGRFLHSWWQCQKSRTFPTSEPPAAWEDDGCLTRPSACIGHQILWYIFQLLIQAVEKPSRRADVMCMFLTLWEDNQ